MSRTPGSERVAEAPPRDESNEPHPNAPDPAAEAPKDDAAGEPASPRVEDRREQTGSTLPDTASPKRGISVAWDAALRQMGELSVSDDGEIVVKLNPDDPRIRVLRERRDCPGLVHIISAYVAQYAALGDENAKHVLRPSVLRGADPGLHEHELYAYCYDRVDQPALAHDGD